MHCSLPWSPRMHVTDRVSCSETLLERLLLLLLWGLNQPHNGLWDLCHCRVTAVELGGRQRRNATRTQHSIYTVANHSADLLTREKANIEPLQWQVERGYVRKCIPTLAALDVNNPINAKFPNHTHTASYNRICLPLCSCFGDLQDYFFMGTTLHPQQLLHTGSTVAMAISVPKKREKWREGGREQKKKKKKSIQSWQGNNWFHYIQPADSLYHQWQGDGRHAKTACVRVWVVINYCWGQGCAGHTPWLNETKLISLWHLPASFSGIWRCRDKSHNAN